MMFVVAVKSLLTAVLFQGTGAENTVLGAFGLIDTPVIAAFGPDAFRPRATGIVDITANAFSRASDSVSAFVTSISTVTLKRYVLVSGTGDSFGLSDVTVCKLSHGRMTLCGRNVRQRNGVNQYSPAARLQMSKHRAYPAMSTELSLFF